MNAEVVDQAVWISAVELGWINVSNSKDSIAIFFQLNFETLAGCQVERLLAFRDAENIFENQVII